MKTSIIITITTLFCFLEITYQGQQYAVFIEGIQYVQDMSIRTQTPTQIKWPDHQFKRIYQTTMRQFISKNGMESYVDFPGCHQMTPQLQFIEGQALKIDGFQEKPHIVYTLQDLKNSHHVKDLIIFNNKIYMMLSFGKLNTVQMKLSDNKDSPSTFGKQLSHDLTGLSKVPGDGFFFILNSQLFFTDGNVAICAQCKNQQKPYQVAGFAGYPSPFANIAILSKGFLAIAYADKVVLFKVSKQNQKYQFQNVAVIEKFPSVGGYDENTNKIQDIFYRDNQYALYILDENKGIIRIALQYKSQSVSVQKTSSDTDMIQHLEIQSLQSVKCNIMQNIYDRVYLSCKNKFIIGKIQKSEQGFFTIKTLSQTLNHKINPRQMFVYPDQVDKQQKAIFLIGSNSFRALYLGKFTDYLENHQLDKLYVFNNTYITVNQNNISIGYQSIKPSSILCNIPNYQNGTTTTGTFVTVINTIAQCDPQFIKKADVNFQYSGVTTNNLCVYSGKINVNVWQSGQIQYLWILWVFLGGVGLTISCGLFFLGFKCWQRMKENQIRGQAIQLGQQIQLE